MARKKFLSVFIAALLVAAGVMAFNKSGADSGESVQPLARAVAAEAEASPATVMEDHKAGYAEGFTTGASGYAYPDEAAMGSISKAYLDGFSQGYTDGQAHQAVLRQELCAPSRPARYGRAVTPTSRVLGERVYSTEPAPRRVDRGLGSGTRKALLIGGAAAAGAGIGGAIGGKKGALIGLAAGGGTGTALALTNKPSRAFNRRVTGKDVAIKAAIGAGIGAAVGGLAGGKRGALSGAAAGGGGGALWTLMTGKKTDRY